MWNVPYLVALWNPRRNRVSLWEALVMQVVGVIGESIILFSIPAGIPSCMIPCCASSRSTQPECCY